MRQRGPRPPDQPSAARPSAAQDRLEPQARAKPSLTARRRGAGRRRRGHPLRLAHGEGGAGKSRAADPTSVRHRERRAPPGRGWPGGRASRPNWCARTRSRTGSDLMPCTTDCWPKPIPCPRPSSTSSSPPASCSCSTRSPTRTMSARSCAPRRASRWRRWSPPRGTVRRRPACWRNPPPARSNMCRSSRCRISPARSRQLRERGYLLVGLDSTGDIDLGDAPLRAPLALVLGAEGKGLRQLTRATCDRVARLDLPGRIKSLNVSNAAALALYVASKRAT